MWYPLGKPSGPGVFHLLKGAYGGLRAPSTPAFLRASPAAAVLRARSSGLHPRATRTAALEGTDSSARSPNPRGRAGQNKLCKQRNHAGGEQGWRHGSCASVGYVQKIKGTLGAPEYLKRGERMPAY